MVRNFDIRVKPEEWLPTDIDGCKLWLRSDYAYQDAAKAVPCTADSLIWTGEDKSGEINDFIQATEAKRFVYKTNQLDGYSAWLADIVDDYMSRTVADLLNVFSANQGSLIIIAKHDSTSEVDRGFDTTGNRFGLWLPYAGNIYFDFGDSTDGRVVTAVPAGWQNTYQMNIFYRRTDGTQVIRTAGVDRVSATRTAQIPSTAGALYLSSTSTPYAVWKGYYVEIIGYSVGLTDADITNLENYVKSRYPSVVFD